MIVRIRLRDFITNVLEVCGIASDSSDLSPKQRVIVEELYTKCHSFLDGLLEFENDS